MKIYHFKKVTSTNDAAKEIALQGERDFVVVADEQTKGKGRMSREWLSPIGGLYFSVVTKKNPLLPLISGVSVASSLKNFGLNPEIKWPNDVMIKNKKISGVLIECFKDYCIVGIGVNINVSPLETATSIKDEIGKNISKGAVLNSILKNFGSYRNKNVTDEYKKLSSTIGRKVKIKTVNKVINGKAVDVDEHGRLVLESGERIVSGDVIHLR